MSNTNTFSCDVTRLWDKINDDSFYFLDNKNHVSVVNSTDYVIPELFYLLSSLFRLLLLMQRMRVLK